MATYIIRNPLSPSKVVSCTITFRTVVNKGEEGEAVWLVEINTVEPHKDGGKIPTEFIHLTSLNNLDLEVKKATEHISSQINWEPLVDDIYSPMVVQNSPNNNSVVSIYSDVWLDIKEYLPAAGIDINSIKMFVNDIEVTDELIFDGDPFAYRVYWKPDIRVLDNY